ncbi:MAG TPA: bifunctional 5,10-methylenetetrahydrofolate dehydrogenase/5,10-methenyltetrahydrofolate cyclohydrolase [Spirochaetota bacterium]|nr:bifunctional 5,10-methylenetetrahydrofolate dehydrogenase/5,10-methenyltetrahydrofolate cyclohydrolase [Spirochaetota bacterium]
MQTLDGKLVAAKIKNEVKEQITQNGYKIKLTVILIGDDPASSIYVNSKAKTCSKLHIDSEIIKKPADTSEEELLRIITRLNNDNTVDGILCQLPLPAHINTENILEAVNPDKDVDCFNPYNIGKLYSGHPPVLPCTPAGIMEIFKHYNIDIKGKSCVVVGRSNIVGKPLAQLLLARHGTVTICHSRTSDLKARTASADIVCSAIGKPGFITGNDLKQGCIAVDVGMNRVPDSSREKGYRLCGDFDFESASRKAAWITPVPGGVGPMTIACLMQNVLTCHINRSNKQ